MGGDILVCVSINNSRNVSIHAPAWGATPTFYLVAHSSGFQSTPPHGGRLRNVSKFYPPILFQSTPPHGGRQIASLQADIEELFQSTPPHGGRPRDPYGRRLDNCFNPRPRMGGDLGDENTLTTVYMFQSTPPHGGRLYWLMVSEINFSSFNPRPRMGGDIYTLF